MAVGGCRGVDWLGYSHMVSVLSLDYGVWGVNGKGKVSLLRW